MEKLISCIIPLYNKEKTIERAINSVLHQSYKNLELIIVNDGSTDRSANIVDKFVDQRVKLFNQENSGVSVARNKGIEHTSGELIAFLDADDIWLPNHIKNIVNLYYTYPECGAYSCNFLIMTKGGKEEKSKIKGIQTEEKKCIVENYCKSCVLTNGHLTGPVNSSNVVIKKEALNTVGLFKEGIDNNEDLDLWLRISNYYRIAFTWKVGVKIDRTELKPRKLKFFDERDSYLIISGKEILKRSSQEHSKWLIEYVNKKRLSLAKKYIINGFGVEGRKLILNVKTYYFNKKKILLLIASYFPEKVIDLLILVKNKYRRFGV